MFLLKSECLENLPFLWHQGMSSNIFLQSPVRSTSNILGSYKQGVGCGMIDTLLPVSQEVSEPHHALSTENYA
jgi:hypothetical protein